MNTKTTNKLNTIPTLCSCGIVEDSQSLHTASREDSCESLLPENTPSDAPNEDGSALYPTDEWKESSISESSEDFEYKEWVSEPSSEYGSPEWVNPLFAASIEGDPLLKNHYICGIIHSDENDKCDNTRCAAKSNHVCGVVIPVSAEQSSSRLNCNSPLSTGKHTQEEGKEHIVDQEDKENSAVDDMKEGSFSGYVADTFSEHSSHGSFSDSSYSKTMDENVDAEFSANYVDTDSLKRQICLAAFLERKKENAAGLQEILERVQKDRAALEETLMKERAESFILKEGLEKMLKQCQMTTEGFVHDLEYCKIQMKGKREEHQKVFLQLEAKIQQFKYSIIQQQKLLMQDKNEVEVLTATVQYLQRKTENQKQEGEQLASELKEEKNNNLSLQKDVDAASSQQKMVAEDFEHEKQTMHVKIQALEAVIVRERDVCAQLTQQLQEAAQDAETLKATSKAKDYFLSSKDKKIDQVTSETAEERRHNEKLKAEVESLNMIVQSLQREIVDQKSQMSSVKQEAKQLASELEEEKNGNLSLQKDVGAASSQQKMAAKDFVHEKQTMHKKLKKTCVDPDFGDQLKEKSREANDSPLSSKYQESRQNKKMNSEFEAVLAEKVFVQKQIKESRKALAKKNNQLHKMCKMLKERDEAIAQREYVNEGRLNPERTFRCFFKPDQSDSEKQGQIIELSTVIKLK